MGGLISDMSGTAGHQQQQSHQTTTHYVNPRQQQLFDVLNRAFLGQMVNPPNTAISVPQQQAITQLQQSQGAGSASLANRLSGNAPSTAAPAGTSYAPTAQTGQPQAGLQTREQLGLPDRSSYFTYMPSQADIGAALAPVRQGTPQMTKLANRQTQLQQRIDTRTAAGKDTTKATKRLSKVQQRYAAASGNA